MRQQEISLTQQEILFKPVPYHKLQSRSKEELIQFIELQQQVNEAIQKKVDLIEAYIEELKQKTLLIHDQYIVLKSKFFGKSSERSPKSQESGSDDSNGHKTKKTKIQLPSLRYPDAPLIERDIILQQLPRCNCCGNQMQDSGMTEDSEYLTVIPQQYLVIRQKRHKYRCGKCHGDIVTAPAPPRMKEGSAYSDEMILDVGLSKYCDLVPIDRYAQIAGREGLDDLPAQSLIETTHYLADFTKGAYEKLKTEIIESSILHADETPHRMLEGDKTSNWYLWGFSTPRSSYFECHDTRSGNVAGEVLINSQCHYLVSDVFSGYAKAVKESNKIRYAQNLPPILNVYCNAHARRKFDEAKESFSQEAEFFIDRYRKIYHLESLARGQPPNRVAELRAQMVVHYEAMKTQAMTDVGAYSSKSSMGKAMSYFLKNYSGLTLFLKNESLPIDNNSQERLLRNPVIGRKTWYGTHSKRGAQTAAILFSLVESCKLNKVNPREYFRNLIADLHSKKPAYTPAEFKNLTA